MIFKSLKDHYYLSRRHSKSKWKCLKLALKIVYRQYFTNHKDTTTWEGD